MSYSFNHKNCHWCVFWMVCITSSSCGKLLGITVDSGLKFDQHISDLCEEVSRKINK